MKSNIIICKIINYIDENLNKKITINELEKITFYNRYYIMRLFKKELAITIIDYINSLRVYNSIIQIRDTNKNMLNIAYKNGFYSLEYFSETIKKFIGVNPSILKKYFNNKYLLNYNTIEKINNSIINLYNLKIFKERYLQNKKVEITNAKKLTIFKNKVPN